MDRQLGLVVDVSGGRNQAWIPKLVHALWPYLSQNTTTSLYTFGRTAPISVNAASAELTPPRLVRSLLIGPILETAPAKMQFVAIAHGRVLDLVDFYHPIWFERIVLVTDDRAQRSEWKSRAIYTADDTAETILEAILTLPWGT